MSFVNIPGLASLLSKLDDKNRVATRTGKDGSHVRTDGASLGFELRSTGLNDARMVASAQIFAPLGAMRSALPAEAFADRWVGPALDALSDCIAARRGSDWYGADLQAPMRGEHADGSDSYDGAVSGQWFDHPRTLDNDVAAWLEANQEAVRKLAMCNDAVEAAVALHKLLPVGPAQKAAFTADGSGMADDEDLQEALERVNSEQRRRVASNTERRVEPGEWRMHRTHVTRGDGRHLVTELVLETGPLVLHEKTQLMLEGVDSLQAVRPARVGFPTAAAWRINYGDMAVFGKRPKTKSKNVFVLVDLSGSMGCWCDACNNRSRPGTTVDNGYLAFQAVGAIGAAVPRAEIYGFGSSNGLTYLCPLEVGRIPQCRGNTWVPGGNEDCAALLEMERRLAGIGNTLAVVVSDGQPAEGCWNAREHTMQLGKQFYDAGMRFASVLIGDYGGGIYPEDITYSVRKVEDISGMGPFLETIGGFA
jgi:Mg-chelatase subunit ChlD